MPDLRRDRDRSRRLHLAAVAGRSETPPPVLPGVRGADGDPSRLRLAPPTGFEPVISTLKGWRPRPLDDGGRRPHGRPMAAWRMSAYRKNSRLIQIAPEMATAVTIS